MMLKRYFIPAHRNNYQRQQYHNIQSVASDSSISIKTKHVTRRPTAKIEKLGPMSMSSPRKSSETERHPKAVVIQPSSPRYPISCNTPTLGAQRKIGIPVDLSDESAFAVKWAVQNYLRKGDAVVLIHVRPTSILYGADWGSMDVSVEELDVDGEESKRKMEDDFDAFTNSKSNDLAQPLVEEGIPFKIHIVKDHDMKERLCLEVERLGLSTVIMGSRGFGASRRATKGRLGSVSDYCVQHCVCPVVVVRFADEKDGDGDAGAGVAKAADEFLDATYQLKDPVKEKAS